MTQTCSHLDQIDAGAAPSSPGCEDCLRTGARWGRLRLCPSGGHVGSCDGSPNKPATAHFHSVGRPLIQSYGPGGDWVWCYRAEVAFVPDGVPSHSHP